MENKKIAISVEQQFGEVIDIILRHKSICYYYFIYEVLLFGFYFCCFV